MTAMIPALAVTALLHDRPTAITMFPTRGGSSVTAAAARSNPLTLRTAKLVAGSQPASSASCSTPSWRRTRTPSPRPSAEAIATTTSSLWTRPLTGRPRPRTWTTVGATAVTASAISVDRVANMGVPPDGIVAEDRAAADHPNGQSPGLLEIS